MKLIILFLSFIFFHSVNGQIKEGYIQYTIDVEAVDSSLETIQSVGLLHDSKMEIYFTPTQLRIDFTMGRMSSSKMIIDYEKDTSVALMTNVYGNYAAVSSVNNLKYQKKDESSSIQLFEETRVILGYTCKKAIVSSKGQQTTYWYTTQIKIDFKGNEFFATNLPGFPLLFSKIEKGVYMEYQASNIMKELNNKVEIFSLKVPKGYTLMPKQ